MRITNFTPNMVAKAILIVGSVFWTLAPVLNNSAMLIYVRSLVRNPSNQAVYPHWKAFSQEQDDIAFPKRLVSFGLRLTPDNIPLRWSLGRLLLADGDSERASRVLALLATEYRNNLIFSYDLFASYKYSEAHSQLVDFYQRYGMLPGATRVISDTLAVAYHEMAARNQIDFNEAMREVFKLRPGDLYAAYQLRQKAIANGDQAATQKYETALQVFPFDAVSPSDERLLDYQVEAIPFLVKENLWGETKALNVLSFLIWHDNIKLGKKILERLIAEFPASPLWAYYLGELYLSQGNDAAAERQYSAVLTDHPDYTQAYLRLGMIWETQGIRRNDIELLESAAKSYQQYCELEPGDVVGAKRLTEVLKKLEAVGYSWGPATAEELEREWLAIALQQGPATTLNQRLKNNWILLGYRGNMQRLVRGEPTPLSLYWQAPTGAKPKDEANGWYFLSNNRWVQISENAYNLVLDGGFELGMVNGMPVGFPYDRFPSSNPNAHELVLTERNGLQTTVALLKNTQEYTRTSFASSNIPVSSDDLYLYAGWVLSEEGDPLWGQYWRSGSASAGQPRFSYTRAPHSSGTWGYFTDVVQPMPDTEGAEVRLLNWSSIGRVYFDDVAFVRINRPD